jgi:hypothetical protein
MAGVERPRIRRDTALVRDRALFTDQIEVMKKLDVCIVLVDAPSKGEPRHVREPRAAQGPEPERLRRVTGADGVPAVARTVRINYLRYQPQRWPDHQSASK